MKMNYIRQTLLLAMTLMIPFSGHTDCFAQNTPKIDPYMLFTYLKDTDSRKILQVKMTNITQTGEVPLAGLTIGFHNNENFLGTSVTDESGSASYAINDSLQLFKNEDGSWPFTAVFEGDSLTVETSGELSIYDVDIVMELSEEEGERFVTLHASVPSADGPVPVNGEEIGVYVPRMFSLLPVSTGLLDETGTFRARFPYNIPGDSLGNLTVIGRFNDNYFYGNVEKREEAMWGTRALKTPPVYRSLWSTLAPKWMVVTLAIMLLGVWSQYALVLINLFRIKRNSLKKQE
jgi:hypothetical protein